MSEKTLTRAQLLTLFSGGPQGPAAVAQVERAIVSLGWQAKASYKKDDVQALTAAIARQGQADLAQADDPAARAMAAKLGPLLAEVDARLAALKRDA